MARATTQAASATELPKGERDAVRIRHQLDALANASNRTPRLVATPAENMPHIIAGLTAMTVMLITMVVGSTALGKTFRRFSWTTFATVIVFGALTVPSGMKLAAGEPTPGMGLLERLAYYSMLVWIAGLSLALLRRHEGRIAPWSVQRRCIPLRIEHPAAEKLTKIW